MWCLAAVFFALRSRRRTSWAVPAGIAFGIAVLVRPGDLLLVIALALALPPRPRAFLLFLLGSAPPAAFFLFWNQAAFGNPFRTGYSPDLPGGLSAANFPGRFRFYGVWLVRMLSPLVIAGWALAAASRRFAARDRALLLLWFGSFFLFYCFWAAWETWWYTRFLLPAIPALLLASLLAARNALQPGEYGGGVVLRRVLSVVAFAVVLAFEAYVIRDRAVLRAAEGDKVYAEASRWAETKVPPHSFVVSRDMSGALRYYTGLTPVRWDRVEPDQSPVLKERARTRGFQWFALTLPAENGELEKRLPWGWTKVGTLREATLWRPAPDR
jgi:hypothetical protein